MKETSADPPDIDSQRTGARPDVAGFFRRFTPQPDGSLLPVTEPSKPISDEYNSNSNSNNKVDVGDFAGPAAATPTLTASPAHDRDLHHGRADDAQSPAWRGENRRDKAHFKSSPGLLAPPGQYTPTTSQDERQGSVVAAEPEQEKNNDNNNKKKKRTFLEEAKRSLWMVATYSWLNVLLVFVPVGIIVANIGGVSGGIVFAMNCIAVIPLAGLLAYATECVATNMGDSLGALLNVTFGNAVELIIFIALVQNKIRIVQASLLGSILANLLLILGMSFFFGGMRFREQIYNSTVTQMSACLLSLSVISLVLPTAFYASFQNQDLAESESLKVSRGTSVILLLVYIIYLLFQLKSHAYMYESTPQHIVDAESTPGPAAGWLESSTDSSSSSSSDSDSSGQSHDTVRRKMKKVLRSRRRRKSSIGSVDTNEMTFAKSPLYSKASPQDEFPSEGSSTNPQLSGRPRSAEGANEEAVEGEKSPKHYKRKRFHRHKHKKQKKKAHHESENGNIQPTSGERLGSGLEPGHDGEPRRVDFAIQDEQDAAHEDGVDGRPGGRRPFPALRGMSVKNLAPSVFVQKPDAGTLPPIPAGSVPRVRYGIRRTNSLPDRLKFQHQIRPPGAMLPSQIPLRTLSNGLAGPDDPQDEIKEEEELLTRGASVVLLFASTALVAVCAEFLISSIEEVVQTSSVGETFIGLIILPIVGNAAEHVTALTVAMKNKMDLAIGVAVGSSIQIALFVTPLVVILGWIIDKQMTLHFTLFETVCLFVSAFIVNFLVLDGRSNYLEGALLCAVYLIIAIVAFFYPDQDQASLS